VACTVCHKDKVKCSWMPPMANRKKAKVAKEGGLGLLVLESQIVEMQREFQQERTRANNIANRLLAAMDDLREKVRAGHQSWPMPKTKLMKGKGKEKEGKDEEEEEETE
jgi:hypothetical protein